MFALRSEQQQDATISSGAPNDDLHSALQMLLRESVAQQSGQSGDGFHQVATLNGGVQSCNDNRIGGGDSITCSSSSGSDRDDANVSFAETSRFTGPEGDLSTIRLDAIPFGGVKSVKQVYDALLYYFFNMEISISEVQGEITI